MMSTGGHRTRDLDAAVRTLREPHAVVFDLGGGLFDSYDRPAGVEEVAIEVVDLLARGSGFTIGSSEVADRIRQAATSWSRWKNASSEDPFPREFRWTEFWDLVSDGWPPAPRALLQTQAMDLCLRYEAATMRRCLISGIRETLDYLATTPVRTAVLSNALAGALSRRLVADHGLEPLLGPQLYSDEMGIRKPNPRFLEQACAAMDVEPAATWLIGDRLDRDVRCARRAGATAVLMPGDQPPADEAHPDHPDLVVADGFEFLEVLRRRLGQGSAVA
jgi:N-acetyl-D-muramate 6-phosphate phosphatase